MYIAVPADSNGKVPFELSHLEGRGDTPEEAAAALEDELDFVPERIVILNNRSYTVTESI